MPTPLKHGEECTFLKISQNPDAYGTVAGECLEGDQFTAFIVLESSIATKTAEQTAQKDVYRVFVEKDLEMPAFSVFKRNRDGQLFKTIGNAGDAQTPMMSPMHYKFVTAERYTTLQSTKGAISWMNF